MDLLPGFSAGALQTALMGLGLGTLCYQRGFIPLHASAVAIGGRAVALAGRHGTGKSTLAAKLADRGHLVLSDDIAPFLERREWTVLLPSSRHLRLRGDALRPLGRADAALIKANISGKPKFHVPLEQNSTAAAPPPLAALVNLIRVETDEREEPQPLHGIARVRAVARSIWRRELTNFYPGAARMTANLSLPGVRLFEFRRKRSFDTIEQACDQIEELAATVAA
jgi:hypothetical protein